VWWSLESQVLSLKVQAPFGLRRDDLIVKDVPPEVLRRGLDTYQTWKAGREADVSAASRASIEVLTATKAAAAADLAHLDDTAVMIVDGNSGIARPGGTRFGSLVHALLADVPFGDEGLAALARLAEAHGRILGATSEEVEAGRNIVREVLGHPLLKAAEQAAREGLCYREMPVTYRLPSGVLVEGYVDLAFRQGSSMVVVDFKTDRELEGALEQYRKQVSLYASAIGQTAGLPTKSVLMRV